MGSSRSTSIRRTFLPEPFTPFSLLLPSPSPPTSSSLGITLDPPLCFELCRHLFMCLAIVPALEVRVFREASRATATRFYKLPEALALEFGLCICSHGCVSFILV